MAEQNLDDITAFVTSSIPIMGHMGLKIVELGRGVAAAEIPLAENMNHIGMTYAGSLFTVAEVLGGAIGITSFDRLEGFFPVIKSSTINFRRPGLTAVRATARLSDEEIDRIQDDALANGKAEFILESVLTNESGEEIATTSGVYQMRKL